MATYNIIPLSEMLPENLDELKTLSDAVQTERTLAANDVQDGRMAMDKCDRIMKILKSKVEEIMGIKSQPTNPKPILKPEDVRAPKNPTPPTPPPVN